MSVEGISRRDFWARHISEQWAQALGGWGGAVKAIHATGLALESAKSELEHGTFMEMVENDLPFQKTKVESLIAISRSGLCQNPVTAGNLPISWNTLYELSRLDENVLEAAVQDGRVHIDMTRADAKKLATADNLREGLKKRKRSVTDGDAEEEGGDDEDEPEAEATPVAVLLPKVERAIRTTLKEHSLNRAQRETLFYRVRQSIDALEQQANLAEEATSTEGEDDA